MKKINIPFKDKRVIFENTTLEQTELLNDYYNLSISQPRRSATFNINKMEKQIDLKAILAKHNSHAKYIIKLNGDPFRLLYGGHDLRNILKEVWNTAVDECIKAARTRDFPLDDGSDTGGYAIGIDRDSIEQVKTMI